jgi:hypothetical protein
MAARRAVFALATALVLTCGLSVPARAATDSSPTDTLTGGTVTVVVGQDPTLHIPTWTTTISGQVAGGGRVFKGSASGSNNEGQTESQAFTLAGTSATGTINLTCVGEPGAPPTPPPLLDDKCSVSIDGAPAVALEMIFALAPTSLTTYRGVYAAVPDAEGLPSLGLNLGTASATVFVGPTGDSVSFAFDGQIAVGGQSYHGLASGATIFSSATPVTIDVPPFSLSGTSASGSISATCSGEFVTAGLSLPVPGLSVLGCDGSANGGSAGHTTLVSVYRETGSEIHFGTATTYAGVFTGL